MADVWSPLARRLRRLAEVVAVLAVAAAVFGLVPNGMDVYSHGLDRHSQMWVGSMHAGGWAVAAWAILQVVSAKPVHGEPTRSLAVVWIVWSFFLDAGGVIAWVFGEANLMHTVPRWPGHIMGYCALATAVLVFAVVPIVLLVSSRDVPSDSASARVVG